MKKRSASQNGSRSRRKGHQFEREVAIALRPIFPEARRHLEYQDAECNGIDLVHTGAFKIQCKKHQGYAPINAMKEIEHDPALGDIPILITAGDGVPAMVVMPFEDWLRLIQK